MNTGSGCHLDAEMVRRALDALDPSSGSLRARSRTSGNLVCPALFDLGEAARVVVMSVTEGDDKPLKYPHMFRTADVLVLNKVDLLPHVEFDVERCTADARRLKPDLDVLTVSATRGDGLDGLVRLARRSEAGRGDCSLPDTDPAVVGRDAVVHAAPPTRRGRARRRRPR